MTIYRPKTSTEHSYLTSTTYFGAGPQWRSSIPLFTVMKVKEILCQEGGGNPMLWRSKKFYVIKVEKILRHEGQGNPVMKVKEILSKMSIKSYVIKVFGILCHKFSTNLIVISQYDYLLLGSLLYPR